MFIKSHRFVRSQPNFESLDIVEYRGGTLTEARSADDMPVISHVGDIAYRVGIAVVDGDRVVDRSLLRRPLHAVELVLVPRPGTLAL